VIENPLLAQASRLFLQSELISSYPFAIFGEDWKNVMKGKKYPTKGNTEVGNDVWIGIILQLCQV
jgi:hypothetical protein